MAAGFVATASAAGTSQIGEDSNVIRLDDFSQASLLTLSGSWTLTDLSVSGDATIFTSGSTAATIAEKEGGTDTITTYEQQGNNERYIYSTVVTIDAASIAKSAPVLSGEMGLSVDNGLIKASYKGNTWNDSANTGIQVLTSDANADGTLTIGMSFCGNSGTTIYVSGRSVTMSNLKNTTKTTSLTLAGGSDGSDVTYSNLYVFNTGLSDEDMQATMAAASGNTQSDLGTLTWAGTEAANTWNLESTNTIWRKDDQAAAFSWGKYTTVFDTTATSKTVSLNAGYQIGAVIQIKDDYTFDIADGSGLFALNGSVVSAGKTLTIKGTAPAVYTDGLTLEEGSILSINSFNRVSIHNLIEGTSGAGTLKFDVGNNIEELHGTSDSSALVLNTDVHVIGGGISLVGSLAAKDKLTISSGKKLTVDGTLWSKRSTTVVNGVLNAGKVWIGHEEEGAYPGKLQLNASGSIKTAEISFKNNGGDTKTASTFEMSGGVLEFTQATSSAFLLGSGIDTAYSVTISGGTLKAADSSWKIEGISNMSLGGVIFDIGDGKSITFNAGAMITAGMQAKGSGSLIFGSDTALTADQTVFDLLSGTYSDGQNGYRTKAYVVSTKAGQSTQYTAGGTLTVGSTKYQLKSDTEGVYFDHDATTLYYVNSGEVTYSDTSSSKDATGFIVNGGTLEMQKELVSGGTLNFRSDAGVKLADGITLTASQVQKADGVTATLDGSGTYVTETAQSLGGLSLASDWTGTVQLSGFSGKLAFSTGTLANENSAIELKGVSGWLGINGTSNAKLILTDKENGNYALTVTAGSTVRTHTFSGPITGTGTWAEVNSENYSMVYRFTGDISGWTGQYVGNRTSTGSTMRASFINNTNGSIGLNAIKNLGATTLYVGIQNDSEVTMNGNFIKEGEGALNLYVGTAYGSNASNDLTTNTSATSATFGGDSVTLSELNISEDSSATFQTTSPADLSADKTKSATVEISKLTGSGNLVLKTATSEHASSKFRITSLQGYTGSISIERTENGGTFTDEKAVLSTGSGSAVSLSQLNLRGGAGAKINAEQNLTIQSLSASDNNKLDIAVGNAATVTARTGDSTLSLGEVTYSGSSDAALSISKSGAAGAISIDKLEVSGSAADTGLVMTLQNATVSVTEMVLTGGNVGAYTDSGATTEATISTGTLTVSGNSNLSANLVLQQNASLTLNDSLAMGSTLTLNSGTTLSGTLFDNWDKTQALTLFTGVDELNINGARAGEGTLYAASGVFSNEGMSNYSLKMTGGVGGHDYVVQLVANNPSPEPTTATLSLLALIGLAARRRRKA